MMVDDGVFGMLGPFSRHLYVPFIQAASQLYLIMVLVRANLVMKKLN